MGKRVFEVELEVTARKWVNVIAESEEQAGELAKSGVVDLDLGEEILTAEVKAVSEDWFTDLDTDDDDFELD